MLSSLVVLRSSTWLGDTPSLPHGRDEAEDRHSNFYDSRVNLGIGVIPWSPLARGRLTRDWDDVTERSGTDEFGKRLYSEHDRPIVERVAEIAAERGLSRAQIALAWLHAKSVVTAPIVGVTKLPQLEDALASVEVDLTADEIEQLETPYEPHAIAGHS